MNYHSTRSSREKISAAAAVLRGIAPDGGLYMPERLDLGFDWRELMGIPAQEMAARILEALLQAKGPVVSRDRLMERLWETDNFVDENTLTVNVTRLRKKLDAFGLENAITTKKVMGYLIAKDDT